MMIMRQGDVQTSEYDLQTIMYPIICKTIHIDGLVQDCSIVTNENAVLH